MRIGATLLTLGVLVLAALPVAAEDGLPPEALVQVAIEGPAGPVYVHQPFTLTLRVQVDEEGFDRHVVPLFRRAMDVPIQVLASALEPRDGLRLLGGAEAAEAPGPTFALGDRVVAADRVGHATTPEGRRRTVLELRRSFVADRAGAYTFPAPSVRLAYAERVERDFLGNRIATTSRPVVVEGAPTELEVRALPEAGRPPGFVDAVGAFEVDARRLEAAPPTVRLRLAIRGRGNLADLTPPPLDGLEGFRLLGLRDETRNGERTLTADLVETGETATEIPPVPFAFFDPYATPPTFRVVETPPLPLAAGPELPPEPKANAVPEFERFGPAVALALLILVVVLFFLLWRGRAPEAPRSTLEPAIDAARLRGAREAMQQALEDPGRDLETVWVELLAAWLGVPPPAVIDAELAARLEDAGLDSEVARRVERSVVALVASRYGGTAAEGTRAEVAALQERLGEPAVQSSTPARTAASRRRIPG